MALFNKDELVSFLPSDDSFTVKGEKFYIYTEKMGFERMVRFQEIGQEIISGKSVSELHNFINDLFKTSRSDGTLSAINGDIQRMLFNHLKTIENQAYDRLIANQSDKVLELCCLFIYTENEDMMKIDPDHFDEKIKAWKEHCDYFSFFLLAAQHFPTLIELLNTNSEFTSMKAKVLKEARENLTSSS